MKKLKEFIDNLPSDKKSHVALGNIVNPPIILMFLVLGFLVQKFMVDMNFLWFGYLGVIACGLVHYVIERWQRKTVKGRYELLDALAGSSSAILIGLITGTTHILQNLL